VLVDRVMWLAAASPNGQVRAIASLKLAKLAARARAAVAKTEADTAQRTADGRRHQNASSSGLLESGEANPFAAPDAPPARQRRAGDGLARRPSGRGFGAGRV